MHDAGARLQCVTRERQVVPDAVSEASGGAPWLRNDVRRAATCWLPIRDRPWQRREHEPGRSLVAGRRPRQDDNTNCEGAQKRDVPLEEYRSRRKGLRGGGRVKGPDPRRRRKRRERGRHDRVTTLAATRATPTRQVGGTARSGGNRLTKWSSAASVASPLQRRVRRARAYATGAIRKATRPGSTPGRTEGQTIR